MKKIILATGMSGLVGSRVKELLSESFEFYDLSLMTGIDITDLDQVLKNVEKVPEAKIILHLAAKTDVDECEDEKILGEESQAWLVNVGGTENIVSAARKFGKKVIYISTDFVFDGTKEFYTEEDKPNPLNWYGYTKYKGEQVVQEAGIDFMIVRIAYPYRGNFFPKKDFVRRFLEKMSKKEKIFGLIDHFFTPTFIDDIAGALKFLLERNFSGIYHVVGSQSLSVYEAVKLIATTFKCQVEVEPIKREKYFQGRAFRPFKLSLRNDKIAQLGVKMKNFLEGLLVVKRQMNFFSSK